MRLNIRPLIDIMSVNSFEITSETSWTEGDVLQFTFQLCDVSLDTSAQGYSPAGRRYVPAAGATLSVVLENVDDARKITRLATQPFAADGSIWSIPILATDKTRGTPQVRFTLTEPGGVVTSGVIKNLVRIWSATNCEG